ncbi:MAG: ABC transporter ATP-binding protein [Thermomicrobiales bacterium]
MIDIRHLHFRYPEAATDALVDVNLKVDAGQFALLAGQSGSGKSTLLRCMNGLIPHFHGGFFSGKVIVDGRNTIQTAPRDLASSVGTVFQDPEAQLVTDTAEDEMAFSLANLGHSRSAIPGRIATVCAGLGIEHLRTRRISSLSGGERQLVALAAALAPGPDGLLLDEPTSQLDPSNAATIIEALKRQNRQRGVYVVLAEHRLERLLENSDTLYVASDGHISGCESREARLALVRQGLIPSEHDRLALFESPAAGDEIATLAGVSFSYGRHQVLRDIDMVVREGETIALLGPNGSGKTTLLKHLIGLLRPDTGVMVIDEIDQVNKPVQRIARTVGYVPQQATLMLHQETVAKELLFTLDSLGRDGSIREEIERVGLGGFEDRHPLDLSGGERQRLAVAAVTVAGPRLLLLDEPTRGLPWSMKRDLARMLRAKAGQGCAVIVATHDEDFARAFASRRIVLSDGSIVEDEPCAAVNQPEVRKNRDDTPLLTGSNLD